MSPREETCPCHPAPVQGSSHFAPPSAHLPLWVGGVGLGQGLLWLAPLMELGVLHTLNSDVARAGRSFIPDRIDCRIERYK